MSKELEIEITPGLIHRFWAKVRKTNSCWLWTASRDTRGYGNIGADGARGRLIRAHRLSWIIHFGPIPAGMLVCHDCPGGDNPACVNPEHLWLGTKADNSADMCEKGRGNHFEGEQSRHHVLTEIQVKKIRTFSGLTLQAIADFYGVTKQTIHKIRSRKSWRHI